MIEFECAIKELPHDTTLSSAGFEDGPKIDPLRLIFTYDSDEWETFVDEWVHSLKEIYADVVRPVVSRIWWKFSGGVLRACGFGPDQAARSSLIGAMG